MFAMAGRRPHVEVRVSLSPADNSGELHPLLRQAVAELRDISPDVVIPMHCSGPGFQTALREVMAERLVVVGGDGIFEADVVVEDPQAALGFLRGLLTP